MVQKEKAEISVHLNRVSEENVLPESAIILDRPFSSRPTPNQFPVYTKNCQVDISFSDISCSIKSWILDRCRLRSEQKQILKGISGDFKSYELTGILGPSGSGKSTLFDILAGYSLNYSGEVLHNGEKQRRRRQCAYIMQDCSLHSLLTVREAMVAAAHLKLGQRHSLKHKQAVVTDILLALELLNKSDCVTGTLSGGEKKRLAIALELVNNPPIMFFDEPTSGLDYHTAKRILVHLKQLAEAGHNIVCSLHQPSASMFEQLDHLYVIAEGQCVYQGDPKALTAFLDGLQLSCPKYYNPADYSETTYM